MLTKLPQLLLLFLSVSLFGCSTLPEPLASEDPNLISDYQTWQVNSDTASQIRLGGVIANVSNLEDKTRVEVVNLPISSSGKPDIRQEPSGRFVVYIDGFADPVTLAEGRLISVLGYSQAKEKGSVGDFEYEFPVLNALGWHLWRIEERVIVHEVNRYLEPCFGLYCRDSDFGGGTGIVVKEVR
ncbi:Slp family lipoprotein [Vibrio sinaloensis]|uniref:Slp family lipoprotein n=1 Tax=Photobacterium sp. (strain ATCC 43367) TaxID=379097 RepID=UPI002055C9C6|nr:Slp family lipoprotein [Vibrio sinaloensis]UPQ89245.1 Slp family lipoprotein [Vibrio sinaloensis]